MRVPVSITLPATRSRSCDGARRPCRKQQRRKPDFRFHSVAVRACPPQQPSRHTARTRRVTVPRRHVGSSHTGRPSQEVRRWLRRAPPWLACWYQQTRRSGAPITLGGAVVRSASMGTGRPGRRPLARRERADELAKPAELTCRSGGRRHLEIAIRRWDAGAPRHITRGPDQKAWESYCDHLVTAASCGWPNAELEACSPRTRPLPRRGRSPPSRGEEEGGRPGCPLGSP